MTYPDTVQLATLTTDGYGDKTVTVETESKANFIQRLAVEHSVSADGITSDATVYLDPTNGFVLSKLDSVQGIYISFESEWYRVSHVDIARRKLLNNAIDNIYCQLEKEPGVAYVTYVS